MRHHTISFKNAAAGFVTAARTQANIRIHLLITAAVFMLAVYLKITIIESLLLLLTVAVVLVAEMINTSLEFLSDAVTLAQNPYIGQAKDVAAGAVLVSAVIASLVGMVIFLPKLLNL